MSEPETKIEEEEARRIMSSGLGRAELEFATSICTPLWWVIKQDDGKVRARNGTAFFLDTGERLFAVTATHVLAGLETDQRSGQVMAIQLGSDIELDFCGRHKVIARNDEIDITTFHITPDEVRHLGKNALTGSQAAWPPLPPEKNRGIYFSGFAGQQTVWLSPNEISFGATPGSGVADVVGHRDIWTVFERSNWIDSMNLGLPPERFDFGGISGGPMLSVIERNGIRSHALAGVIYEGPNPSTREGESIPGFEAIKARRADFIQSDGTIDITAWSRSSG